MNRPNGNEVITINSFKLSTPTGFSEYNTPEHNYDSGKFLFLSSIEVAI